jgi:DNA-binding transcriptional ArsR family regulator
MVTHSEEQLDRIFGALADRTRRQLLKEIGGGPCSVKELAAPFDMSRPAISKHLKVLEEAGLIRRDREGRLHRSRPRRGAFREATRWLSEVELFWEDQLDRFQDFVEAENSKKDER